MQLIRSLDDPRKFRKRANVRVFGAHTRHFPACKINGEEIPATTITVTEADLHEIARNCNAAYLDYATPAKLVAGHRLHQPGVPESQQPLEVGFARNFRVEYMPMPSGKRVACLICDEYHAVPHLAECDKRSGRSAEYFPDSKLITGIAMLTRDSALKLGFVANYQRNRICYSMGATNAMPDMIDQDKPKDGMNKPVPYSDEEGQWTDDDEMQYARYKRYARRYMAEGGMPAPESQKPEEMPAAYAASANPVIYQMQQQVAQLQRANIEANAARLLDAVASQVRFDYQRELRALVACKDDAERGQHIQYMLGHYEKLPTSGMIPVAYAASTGPVATGPMAAPSNHEKAMNYMRQHPGMDYFQALEKVQG